MIPCSSVYCLLLRLASKSLGCSGHVELTVEPKALWHLKTMMKFWLFTICSFLFWKQLDFLPEQINYQLHHTDFQESPYCQYSTVQFPTALQSQSLQSHFNTYSLDPQFSGGECGFGSYELNKPTYVVDHDAEDGYSGMKRSRLTHSSIRIKRQEELCVVCGDKASGYHYNALTCEGCKGKDKVKTKLKT